MWAASETPSTCKVLGPTGIGWGLGSGPQGLWGLMEKPAITCCSSGNPRWGLAWPYWLLTLAPRTLALSGLDVRLRDDKRLPLLPFMNL